MLGRPRRSLWASRARRFALGIGATVLYRFLFTLPGINLNFRSACIHIRYSNGTYPHEHL